MGEELANKWLKLTVRPGTALAGCRITNECSDAESGGPALVLQGQGRARPPRSLRQRYMYRKDAVINCIEVRETA